MARFMIDTGEPMPGDPPLDEDARTRLHGRLASVRAGDPCACGTCPSVQLLDEARPTPGEDLRTVLTAPMRDATVLLFVSEGRLSYLELAPHGDEPFAEFPEVIAMTGPDGCA